MLFKTGTMEGYLAWKFGNKVDTNKVNVLCSSSRNGNQLQYNLSYQTLLQRFKTYQLLTYQLLIKIYLFSVSVDE